MDWEKILGKGDRKEVAESKRAAEKLVEDQNRLSSLFLTLKSNCDDAVIVSHGFYALKESSLKSKEIRKKVLRFCKLNIDQFVQWEARENFLRICLIEIEKDERLYEKIAPMVEDASSIVQSYASEYLLRYSFKFDKKDFKKTLKWIETLAGRAAVKARIRKIKKELGIIQRIR